MTFTKSGVPYEHAEQLHFLRAFRLHYPNTLIFAVPNGGARNRAVAGQLKAEGVTPGVPDLFIPAWQTWVEMKRQKHGSVSGDQKHIIAHLEAVGYHVIIARGWVDGIEQIDALVQDVLAPLVGQIPYEPYVSPRKARKVAL